MISKLTFSSCRGSCYCVCLPRALWMSLTMAFRCSFKARSSISWMWASMSLWFKSNVTSETVSSAQAEAQSSWVIYCSRSSKEFSRSGGTGIGSSSESILDVVLLALRSGSGESEMEASDRLWIRPGLSWLGGLWGSSKLCALCEGFKDTGWPGVGLGGTVWLIMGYSLLYTWYWSFFNSFTTGCSGQLENGGKREMLICYMVTAVMVKINTWP